MLDHLSVSPTVGPPPGAYLVLSPHFPSNGSFKLSETRTIPGWKNQVLEGMREGNETDPLFLSVVDSMAPTNFPRPDFNMCIFKDDEGITRGAAYYGPLQNNQYAAHPRFQAKVSSLPPFWRHFSIIH